MVNFTLHTIAALTLSACVAAIPGARTTSTTPFTFAQWVEDIIADPNGDHLSPEEAVAAKNAAVAATPIERRANCEQSWPRANVGSRSNIFKKKKALVPGIYPNTHACI